MDAQHTALHAENVVKLDIGNRYASALLAKDKANNSDANHDPDRIVDLADRTGEATLRNLINVKVRFTMSSNRTWMMHPMTLRT